LDAAAVAEAAVSLLVSSRGMAARHDEVLGEGPPPRRFETVLARRSASAVDGKPSLAAVDARSPVSVVRRRAAVQRESRKK